MSFDLVVINPLTAPASRKNFLRWFDAQSKWEEGHSYDDHALCAENLRNWFLEMVHSYPPMNGPLAPQSAEDDGDSKVTDYALGKDLIYASFA